jgi:D-sedoheptulose 7-phosphate isomerase
MKYLEYLTETKEVFDQMAVCSENIELSLELLIKAVENQNKILLCGNGGSAADAQHWAAELMGVFRGNGKPIKAISLTTDTSVVSSIANDISWNEVYSRQLLAHGSPGDILIAISTSGNSPNVFRAIETAKELGMFSILVSGCRGGKMKELSSVSIIVPSSRTEIIQHAHLTIGHYLTGALADRFR